VDLYFHSPIGLHGVVKHRGNFSFLTFQDLVYVISSDELENIWDEVS
jgi:hypothetical protein